MWMEIRTKNSTGSVSAVRCIVGIALSFYALLKRTYTEDSERLRQNCFLVLALCAQRSCAFSANPAGIYTLKLFKEGAWRYLHVDDRLPCSPSRAPHFCSSKDPNQVRPPIIRGCVFLLTRLLPYEVYADPVICGRELGMDAPGQANHYHMASTHCTSKNRPQPCLMLATKLRPHGKPHVRRRFAPPFLAFHPADNYLLSPNMKGDACILVW